MRYAASINEPLSPYGRRAIEARFPRMGAFGGLGATWQYKQAWRRLCGPHLRRLPEDKPGVALGLTDPAIPDQRGEHSLDLRQNAAALSEVGGDVVAEQRAGRSDQGGHDGGGLSEVAGREYCRVDLQHMAHVADQDERWPPMVHWQRAGIAFGLAAGVAHQHIPAAIDGSDARTIRFDVGEQAGLKRRGLRMSLQAGLFSLKDKTATLVQVDAAGCGGPIRQEVLHRSFEDVVVVSRRGTGWLWHWKTERVAELVQEHDVVGAFLAAFTPLPAGDEGFDRLVGPVVELAHRPERCCKRVNK